MIARRSVVGALLAAGCAGQAAPASVLAPPVKSPAPGAASSTVTLADARWTIAVDGTIAAVGEHGQTVTTPTFVLGLQPWPRSTMFVQTLAEQLHAGHRAGDEQIVLHQRDGGDHAYEVVLDAGETVDGIVLVADPGGGDGAMCSFSLPRASDWRPALAACASVARAD